MHLWCITVSDRNVLWYVQGISLWTGLYELALTDRNMQVKSCLKMVLEVWDWGFLKCTYLVFKKVTSFLAPKWPILSLFCRIIHQRSKFLLISYTLSVGGCWGQPMLLFWKPRMYIKNLSSQHSKTTFKQDFTYIFLSVRANS